MSDRVQWGAFADASGHTSAAASAGAETHFMAAAAFAPSTGMTALLSSKRVAGFAQNSRLAATSRPSSSPKATAPDPLQTAYDRGFAEGAAMAAAEAEARDAERAEADRAIEYSFAQWDEASARDLREKLRLTVMALCEEAVLPLALDQEGLLLRIERAAALLQRATDERHVLLNPVDFDRICHRLPEGLSAQPHPSVEPGGLRIETPDGGIEDGPSHWRQALAEAFREC